MSNFGLSWRIPNQVEDRLDPASSVVTLLDAESIIPDLIRHPVSEKFEKTMDSLRGEYIEPRVKPAMTKIE